MKTDTRKKIFRSTLRVIGALMIVLGVPVILYWFWQPGSHEPLPEFPDNAIWLGHGWLGDDGWFERNHRKKSDFRTAEKMEHLFRTLRENQISIVYPHLCPAQTNGKIAPYDSLQVERFLDLAERQKIKVIPWIGGVLGKSAFPENEKWRKNFVDSVKELLQEHPRLAGLQINIEPLPDGCVDFLRLLTELKPILQGRILSVAAYPPPTNWQRNSNVHWNLHYILRVARACDQIVVMMYDTSIPLEKCYVHLISHWTTQINNLLQLIDCELVLGIPAYEDAGVGYHHPGVENLDSALRGISGADFRNKIRGIAIYCEWEMTEKKWQDWEKYIRRSRK